MHWCAPASSSPSSRYRSPRPISTIGFIALAAFLVTLAALGALIWVRDRSALSQSENALVRACFLVTIVALPLAATDFHDRLHRSRRVPRDARGARGPDLGAGSLGALAVRECIGARLLPRHHRRATARRDRFPRSASSLSPRSS